MKVATKQTIESGVLVIRPADDASERDRNMFAIGSVPIEPNEIYYPATDEQHFDIETHGPWGTVSKVRGLAVETIYSAPYPERNNVIEIRVHGMRSLLCARQSGYDMEGKVSIRGRKVRAFTSSKLFETPDGKLCNVATLYVCGK